MHVHASHPSIITLSYMFSIVPPDFTFKLLFLCVFERCKINKAFAIIYLIKMASYLMDQLVLKIPLTDGFFFSINFW